MRRTGAIVLAIVAVCGGWLLGGHNAPPVQCSYAGAPPGVGPLPGGSKVRFGDARRAVNFPLLTEGGGPTLPEPPSAVWLDAQAQQVATVYRGGEILLIMRANPYAAPGPAFREIAAELSSKVSVETAIQGKWALIIQPHTDACGTNPSAVEVVLYGTDATLYSNTLSTEDLVAFANRLLPEYAM